MTNWILVLASAFALALALPVANAGEIDGKAVLGGAIGGGAGAAVGSAIGGREGAIIGGGLGGALGTAITAEDNKPKIRDRYHPAYGVDRSDYRHDNGLHLGHYKRKRKHRHHHDD
jgi:hypothetical protein